MRLPGPSSISPVYFLPRWLTALFGSPGSRARRRGTRPGRGGALQLRDARCDEGRTPRGSATDSVYCTPAIHHPVRAVFFSVPASYRKRATAVRSSDTVGLRSRPGEADRVPHASNSRRSHGESPWLSSFTGSRSHRARAAAPDLQQRPQGVGVEVDVAVCGAKPGRGATGAAAGPRSGWAVGDEFVRQLQLLHLVNPVRPVVQVGGLGPGRRRRLTRHPA
jgi:hypothetical protein